MSTPPKQRSIAPKKLEAAHTVVKQFLSHGIRTVRLTNTDGMITALKQAVESYPNVELRKMRSGYYLLRKPEDMPKRKYNYPVYNMVAKRLREQYQQLSTGTKNTPTVLAAKATVTTLAVEFAKTFKRDDPIFDHLKFLDQCSPDPERYPFSELWEDLQ